ncbi:MAG: energy transducer TonB [Burkholderiaceae bacterium]
MNAISFSLHNEMTSLFAQRTLKAALVLGLHSGVAGLLMHLAQISAPKNITARVENRPMEVSFVQALPAVTAPQQTVAATKPHAASSKPSRKSVLHLTPQPIPAIPQPTLAATSLVEPATASAAPPPIKQEATPAPVASKAMPTIAAHVDANYSQKTQPPYPALSRRLHGEGKVQLLVDVSPKGEVASILVKQSSGYPRLDEVALNTVRLWRFVPAHQGEVAVADSVVVPILFKLND